MRLGILTSHPIQYQAPWFRELAKVVDLEVFFAHRQTAAEQGKAGFGVAFDWDVDLLSGYTHKFLKNVSSKPGVNHFFGCDTPEIRDIVAGKQKSEKLKAEIGNSESETATSGRQKSESRTQKTEGEGGDFSFQLSAFSFSPFDAFIVTGWHLKSYWQAVRACRRAGVPVLVRGDSQLLTPRSRLKRWAKEILYRPLLRQFDGFLVVGQRNREYLAHYGVPAQKMFFAPHFVDNQWFKGKAEIAEKQKAEITFAAGSREQGAGSRAGLRKQWGASDEDFVALFVGKFIPKKRPADLLRAMAKMCGEPTPHPSKEGNKLAGAAPLLGGAGGGSAQGTKVVAVFVGSGELEKELRDLAARENLRVHFAGFRNQSELPRYYAAADVLVLPSESETWGLVVNEAMACGLPAIVSDAVGCAPDLIDEGNTGFTFPVGDVESLAQRLVELSDMKPQDFQPSLTDKMRAYSVETAVNGTLQAVRSLCGGAGG